VLEAMGARPTELELFTLISSVDARCRGRLSFVSAAAERLLACCALTRVLRAPTAAPSRRRAQGEFLRVIELQHAARARGDDDGDMIDAFVVCGERKPRAPPRRRRQRLLH
jgi:hypothetical protein